MMEIQQQEAIQFGNYEIFRKLAIGGMAELYLAKQRGLGGFERTIVIKCILPHYASDQHFVTMFLDEARIASLLNHPNIVQIYEIGEVGSIYYIAMEFIRGPNFKALRKALFQDDVPSYGLISGIMSQACAGLHHAHCATDEYGNPMAIVHRDVSPTNLILTYEGGVKLLDFGVAKAASKEHKTKAGMVKGKYRYMSPEQILAYPLDHRSDIYALGAILYELSTGVVLFQRRSEAETIRAVYMDPIIPPSAMVAEGYPAQMEHIVMRALERDPGQRYQTADEMRRDLEQFMSTQEMYYGPQQIAESLQSLFSQSFELTLSGGAGNELTRSDFARFGVAAPATSPQVHALPTDNPEELTSPSANPSSPSSFQAPPMGSSPHSFSHSQANPAPSFHKQTQDLKKIPFASSQSVAGSPPDRSGAYSIGTADSIGGTPNPQGPASFRSSSGIQQPSFAHPHLQAPVGIQEPSQQPRETEPKPQRRWLLPALFLLVTLIGLGLTWALFLGPDPDALAEKQLQEITQLTQQKKWTEAHQLLQKVPATNLSARLAQRHSALQKQIQWGRDFMKAQQLHQQGQNKQALRLLRALREQSPQHPRVLALLKTWEKPSSPLIKPLPVRLQPPARQDDVETPPKIVRKQPVRRRKNRRRKNRRRKNRRRKNRRRRRHKHRRRPKVRRQKPVRRRLLAFVPRRVEPIRRPPQRPGVLFVPALPMARVDVDGRLFGFTPINGKSIPVGRHTIRISKSGYHTVRRSIQIRAGRRLVLPIKMRRRQVDPPPIRRAVRKGPKPKMAFSASHLPRQKTLRIYISDRRGIGGNTYTYQFRSLSSRIERDCRRLLGPDFSVRGVTTPLQRYIRRIATLSGRERMTVYPRAIAYVIYKQLTRGRSRSRVSQLLVSYQKRNKFKRYRNK